VSEQGEHAMHPPFGALQSSLHPSVVSKFCGVVRRRMRRPSRRGRSPQEEDVWSAVLEAKPDGEWRRFGCVDATGRRQIDVAVRFHSGIFACSRCVWSPLTTEDDVVACPPATGKTSNRKPTITQHKLRHAGQHTMSGSQVSHLRSAALIGDWMSWRVELMRCVSHVVAMDSAVGRTTPGRLDFSRTRRDSRCMRVNRVPSMIKAELIGLAILAAHGCAGRGLRRTRRQTAQPRPTQQAVLQPLQQHRRRGLPSSLRQV